MQRWKKETEVAGNKLYNKKMKEQVSLSVNQKVQEKIQ